MTKLEELTALLVNEINDFNKGVDKMDKINSELKETKIKIGLTEYKSIIERHQQQMVKHLEGIERFERRFDNKIKQAKIYPSWAVLVFIIALLFSMVLIILWFIWMSRSK